MKEKTEADLLVMICPVMCGVYMTAMYRGASPQLGLSRYHTITSFSQFQAIFEISASRMLSHLQ